MNIGSGRAAVVVLLLLAAQAAPVLHAAFESSHADLHDCCTDGLETPHFETCEREHGHPDCPVCTIARAPLTAFLEGQAVAVEAATLPAPREPETFPADPFHVEIPGSRGPPA